MDFPVQFNKKYSKQISGECHALERWLVLGGRLDWIDFSTRKVSKRNSSSLKEEKETMIPPDYKAILKIKFCTYQGAREMAKSKHSCWEKQKWHCYNVAPFGFHGKNEKLALKVNKDPSFMGFRMLDGLKYKNWHFNKNQWFIWNTPDFATYNCKIWLMVLTLSSFVWFYVLLKVLLLAFIFSFTGHRLSTVGQDQYKIYLLNQTHMERKSLGMKGNAMKWNIEFWKRTLWQCTIFSCDHHQEIAKNKFPS